MNRRDDDIDATAIVVRAEVTPVLAPVVTPTEAKAAMQSYLELCEAVLSDDDYQEFRQNKKVDGKWVSEVKRFKKKSAVKKLSTFWDISVTAPDSVRDDLGDGHYGFRVRAIATRGSRTVEAWGACSTQEERFDVEPKRDESDTEFERRHRKALARAYHDILSTAETRATNRAVMNLIGVGGGEITAEEARGARQGSAPPRGASTSSRPAATQTDDELPITDKAVQWVAIEANKLRFTSDERHDMIREMTSGAKASAKQLTRGEARALVALMRAKAAARAA